MKKQKLQTAYFAMGCFWGPQLLFDKTPGVVETRVGYMGGDLKKFPNPSYEQVCSHLTNYAETTEIVFDKSKITFSALMDKFFLNHNPTTKNRQHFDIGSQYRSAIFYTNEKQKKESKNAIKSKQKDYKSPIVTELVNAKSTKFFPAEEYHQKYLKKRGINVPTCHA